MDSDPLPVLERPDALRRHQIHGNPQEKGTNFCNPSLGTKKMKTVDGRAQRTVSEGPAAVRRMCEGGEMIPTQAPMQKRCPDSESGVLRTQSRSVSPDS